MPKTPRLVVLGAGFAGIFTVKHLKKYLKDAEIDITVVNRTPYFLFTPLVLEVATGNIPPDRVTEDLQQTFGQYLDHLVLSEVKGIDLEKKTVSTADQEIQYDYLLIALGSGTNFYNTLGARENSITLKSLDDALRIKQRLHEIFTAEMRPKINVIGAGSKGVDIAAEIVEVSRHFHKQHVTTINLIDKAQTILPMQSDFFRKHALKVLRKKQINLMTGVNIAEVKENSVALADGTELSSHLNIWTAGNCCDLPPIQPAPRTCYGGRLAIDPFLRLVDHPEVFALGDNSSFAEEYSDSQLPQQAQSALQEAEIAAVNISRLVKQGHDASLQKFVFRPSGFLIPLGQWQGIGIVKGIRLRGFPAWIVRRYIYLRQSLSWRERLHLLTAWVSNIYGSRKF